jgi:hypothetical protein
MGSGLVVLAALRIAARALWQCRAGTFLFTWVVGIVGVVAAWMGFTSLSFYGSAAMLRGMPDPLNGASIWYLLQFEAPLIALGIATGVLVALLLSRHGFGDEGPAARRDAALRRVGAQGEALVARELAQLGLPALHNVVLCGAGWSVELDHVVRVLSGIVILETKTLAGRVTGALDAPMWTRCQANGVEVGKLVNPVLQNEAHVRALAGFLEDPRVAVCGYVVAAGRASFAPGIADAVVLIRDLGWVLSLPVGESDARALQAAWRRLEHEAAKSPARRVPHEVCARRRRRERSGA